MRAHPRGAVGAWVWPSPATRSSLTAAPAENAQSALPDTDPLRRCLAQACFLNLAQRSPQAAPGAHAKYRTLLRRQEAGPHPSSVLFMQRRAPEFVVFSELVETSRTYLRTVTAVEEEWLHGEWRCRGLR